MNIFNDFIFKVHNFYARKLGKKDLVIIQQLLTKCQSYFKLVAGEAVNSEYSFDLLSKTPPDKTIDDKFLLGIFEDGFELIAILDIIRDFPAPGIWFLGLMLLEPDRRNQGLGHLIYDTLEDWMKREGAKSFRLGVVEQNPNAVKFWRRMGFEIVEKRENVMAGKQSNTVIVMQKILDLTAPEPPSFAGPLHHIELNVTDLDRSGKFWGWLLEKLGYSTHQKSDSGISWKFGHTYVSLTQTDRVNDKLSCSSPGLNHLAFHATSRKHVDEFCELLKKKNVPLLDKQHQLHEVNNDRYSIYFRDPDNITIEIVAPE
ncbi:GNAT family N-acetyltransferase [bacterium]|nr:GNAT family N-acetyltransferase [candidate division CSSED10-310 bacterium]